jgi:hypothetical protein
MWAKGLLAVAALLASGCDLGDPGVITNTTPFYQRGYELPLEQAPKFVEETRRFAEQRGIRLLVSTRHFQEGEFAVTLITEDMNILVNNVAKNDVAWVSAIARGNPGAEDRELLREYLASISLGDATDDTHPPLVFPSG